MPRLDLKEGGSDASVENCFQLADRRLYAVAT
jgi:hypothetical protein